MDRRTPDLSLGFKQNPLLKRDKLYSGLTQIFFLHVLPSQHLILWEVKNTGKCVVGWKTKGLGIQQRVGEGYPTALAPQGREEPCMEQGCPPCISHSHPTAQGCQKPFSSSSSSSSHLLSPCFEGKEVTAPALERDTSRR